jgi:hypothetical protein
MFRITGILFVFFYAAFAHAQDVNEIVARSLKNSQADWNAAPQYSFTETDTTGNGDARAEKTLKVTMIEGSPYNELVRINGKDLNSQQKAREQKKLDRETARRKNESTSSRQHRIARYQAERRQDQALMREMIAGFTFKLAGTETADGRECYRVEASPKPGYVPKSRETKVLQGMRGTLWIDVKEYQWVRVEASVFRPVAFGLFIAHVQPGTAFVLDQKPVEGNVWMPSYFEMRVNAKIAFLSHNSLDQERYSDYQRIGHP